MAILMPRAAAQCAAQWLPGLGGSGANQLVRATTLWDPDGPGPAPAVLVAGGDFTVFGALPANRIAAFSPLGGIWSPLGSGLDDAVYALASLPNGELVAAGTFTAAGGVSAARVARWNGTNWAPLGAGIGGSPTAVVRALTVLPNGDLVAAGEFTLAGGVAVANIARWDGTSWSALGSGIGGAGVVVNALAALPNGDVIAGGSFAAAGGVAASCIARWNGTAWSPLGSGIGGLGVTTLATMPNGDLIAGGWFFTAGGVAANSIALWDGVAWSALGAGLSSPSFGSVVTALAPLANGDLVAGGTFNTAGGVSANCIASWDGTTWSALGSGLGNLTSGIGVLALTAMPNGDLIAGGGFTTAGGVNADRIAQWSNFAWSVVGAGLFSGFNGRVTALVTAANGDLVVGGEFTSVDGVPASHVARWNGSAWSALGAGLGGGTPLAVAVSALLALPNGDVLAAGSFSSPGGLAPGKVARWDGTTWTPVGSGFAGGSPLALAMLPNGDLVAGGTFSLANAVLTGMSFNGLPVDKLARWNGSTWSGLGNGVSSNGAVSCLLTLPNGDLVAGGYFATAGGVAANGIARWNGTAWSPLGAGVGGSGAFPTVYAMTTLPNGDLVAGGTFTTAGGIAASLIARWNGSNWSALGTGLGNGPSYAAVSALTTLPSGDLVAAGAFTTAGGAVVANIARWNGASWSALDVGVNGPVSALAKRNNGDLAAGGQFTTAGPFGFGSNFFALLGTTCPALAIVQGAGCVGAGGPNALAAVTLPWTGSTFRSLATGLAPNSLAISVHGLSTIATALSAILPQGVPGCTLLVSPDLLEVYLPLGSSVETRIAIPSTVALAGQVVHEQVVPMVFDALGNLTALTSTNALSLVIGTF